VRREDDLSFQRLRTADGGVEVVDLEPERDAVSVWTRHGVADSAVMVLDVEGVQLQHERAVAEQALVLLAAVTALAAEELLVEATAPRDVGDRDQRLRTASPTARSLEVAARVGDVARAATHGPMRRPRRARYRDRDQQGFGGRGERPGRRVWSASLPTALIPEQRRRHPQNELSVARRASRPVYLGSQPSSPFALLVSIIDG
jgi:hypothetical protein